MNECVKNVNDATAVNEVFAAGREDAPVKETMKGENAMNEYTEKMNDYPVNEAVKGETAMNEYTEEMNTTLNETEDTAAKETADREKKEDGCRHDHHRRHCHPYGAYRHHGPEGYGCHRGHHGPMDPEHCRRGHHGMSRPAFGSCGPRPGFGPYGMGRPVFGPCGPRPGFGPYGMGRPAFGPCGPRPGFGPYGMSRPAFGPCGPRPGFGPYGISRPAFGPCGPRFHHCRRGPWGVNAVRPCGPRHGFGPRPAVMKVTVQMDLPQAVGFGPMAPRSFGPRPGFGPQMPHFAGPRFGQGMPHVPHGAFDRMPGMGYGPRPGFRMMGDASRPGFGPEFSGPRPDFGGFGSDFSGKPEFGGCGPRPGCHGRHHKGEGARPQMPRSITEDPRYAEMNEDARLAAVLGELGRVEQFMFNRRGGQGRILRLLKENGDMSQRELTFRLGIMPGSASEILAKLEGRGFITRIPDERDRRTALVHLTEEGAAHEAEHAARREARLAAMFSSLTEEEKREYLALSEKLTAAWHQKKNTD